MKLPDGKSPEQEDFPSIGVKGKLEEFISLCRPFDRMYIQTHDFPDHDAVASAFGLYRLLEQYGIQSDIIYQGALQRDNLKSFIDYLRIPIRNQKECSLSDADKIIIVDGCKGNKNVTDLIGDEIGVIDHHEVTKPDDVQWSDIRTHLGACCTLVFSYWEDSGFSVPREVGTALLIGLLVDTAMMTRGLSEEDVIAYAKLYGIAEMQYVNKLLRNNIQEKDLKFFSDAISSLEITKSVGYCYLKDGCNQNLLGILGDFFLALREVDIVLLCAENNGGVNLSMRSERSAWNASSIIQRILKGIGFGGGHGDMAGGIIYRKTGGLDRELKRRLFMACGID